MGTIKAFCNRHKISIESVMVGENPNMADMPRGSYHYKATLKRPRQGTNPSRQMTLFFSMGPALDREPTAPDVLSCLLSDSSSFDNTSSFEEWARELGYGEDSRKAHKTYQAVEKQAKQLKRFLGDLYEDALARDLE